MLDIGGGRARTAADPGLSADAETASVGVLRLRVLALAGAVLAVAGAVALAQAASLHHAVAVVLMIAPLVAGALCAYAARMVPRGASAPWLLLAVASGLSALAQVAGSVEGELAANGAALLNTGSYLCLLASLAFRIHARDRERSVEIALDALLLLAASSTVVFHWAPAAVPATGIDRSAALSIGLHAVPALALGTAVLAGVLLTGTHRGRLTQLWVGAGAILIALAALPTAVTGAPCCPSSSMFAIALVAGWLAIGIAAWQRIAVAARPPDASDELTGLSLRQLIAPAVTLVMGTVVLDAALRPPLDQPTGFSLGLVGLLLALRVSDLLRSTREQPVERRQLAQTRAMVELSHALASTNETEETLALVTRWACRLLGAQSAAVQLLEAGGDELVVSAAHGMPDDVVGMRTPVEGSFSGWVVQTGRARAAANPRVEPLVQQQCHRFLDRSSLAVAPLRFRNRMLGTLVCIARHPFSDADVALLGGLADQAAMALENARLFAQVRHLSFTDPLTGLANRRQLEREIGREFAAAQRGRALVGVMFDLDGFKEYNDAHGHVAGDAALRLFGKVLRTETRAMNLAARYGGDEFFCLLADADAHGAEAFVGRVRDHFARELEASGPAGLSASAGIAPFRAEMRAPEELVDAADRALYESKVRR